MTNLRGNGNEFVNSGVVGLLHRSLEQDEGASEETSAPKKNESFLLLTTIIVGLIVVFYCVCTYQIMRIWLCKVCCGRRREDEDEEGGDTVVVHEGRLFNLSGNQRRAVLEAIFLEASKPATDSDVSQRRRTNSGEKDVGLPIDVEIPGISTSETENSADGNSPPASLEKSKSTSETHEDDGAGVEHLSEAVPDDEDAIAIQTSQDGDDASDASVCSAPPAPAEENTSAMAILARTPEAAPNVVFENHDTPSASAAVPVLDTPKNRSLPSAAANAGKLSATPEVASPPSLSNVRRTLPWQSETETSEEELSLSGTPVPSLSIPTLGPACIQSAVIPEHQTFDSEECKEELEAMMGESDEDASMGNCSEIFNPSSLHLPIPLVRRESFTTVASEYTYDDESTVGHACPICLGGYKKEDMLIVAKHCTHIFHKECLLEWLDKHADCPICRAPMVTDDEMNTAATSLVGKTRMCRAVADNSAPRTTPTRPPTRLPRTGPSSPRSSPFVGTMRRNAQQYL